MHFTSSTSESKQKTFIAFCLDLDMEPIWILWKYSLRMLLGFYNKQDFQGMDVHAVSLGESFVQF